MQGIPSGEAAKAQLRRPTAAPGHSRARQDAKRRENTDAKRRENMDAKQLTE